MLGYGTWIMSVNRAKGILMTLSTLGSALARLVGVQLLWLLSNLLRPLTSAPVRSYPIKDHTLSLGTTSRSDLFMLIGPEAYWICLALVAGRILSHGIK